MASGKRNKEALDRWALHCQDICRATGRLPKGSEEDRAARIRKARSNYACFVQTYFPHLAVKPCGKFQIDAANHVRKDSRARCVFEWARGHAKSSHISMMIPLWLKIQDGRGPMVMALVSKSQDAARRLLGDLQAELEANELYIADFGAQKGEGSWSDGEFITADGDMFIALGRGQSPRGIKRRGIRVNYIVIDDIDDDEMCRNPRRVNDATDWCLTALYGTMDMGRGRFVLVGNRIGRKSVLASMSERPSFHHTVVNALDKNGRPTWKENFTMQEVLDIRLDVGERRFQKEYMNNPVNEGTIFEKKDIRYGKMLPMRGYSAMVCYTDPSFKSGATNDYKATLLVGITPQGAYHVIKAYADQTKVSDMVQWHYDIHNYAGDTPLRYMMEGGFIQDLLLDEFKKVGGKVGWQIPIVADTRKKPDKFARIDGLQPLFQRGEIIFNEAERGAQGFDVLEEQLLLFEKGSRVHDDAPDALEGAIWILSNRTRTSNNRYAVGNRPNRKW
jgi:predicted phage terminase large subunit-like protein